MTAKHVVKGCMVVRVAGDGFRGQTAEVVALDPDDDLALLRVAQRPKSILQIADGKWGDSPKVIQETVQRNQFGQGFTIGYPGNSALTVSENVELPPKTETPDWRHFYRVMDGLTERGDSGSPVLYEDGKVAGVLIEVDARQWIGKAKDGTEEGKGGLFVAGPVAGEFLNGQGVQGASEPAGEPQQAIVHVFCFTWLPHF